MGGRWGPRYPAVGGKSQVATTLHVDQPPIASLILRPERLYLIDKLLLANLTLLQLPTQLSVPLEKLRDR